MKKEHSNAAIALIFFVLGIGIGGTIGAFNGYNLGYRDMEKSIDKTVKDTVIIYRFINYPNKLNHE